MQYPIGRLIAAGTLCSVLYSQPADPQPEPPKTDCALSGQVLNGATGEPLKKATVSLTRMDAQQGLLRRREVDAAGRFEFEGLEPGRYLLSASKNGFADQSYGAKRPGRRRGNPLTLVAKQELKDLIISLAPHGVVIGHVVDEDGEAMAGLYVSAIKPEWQGNKRQIVPYGEAVTNDLGEYRLYGVPPGVFWIQAARQPEAPMRRVEPIVTLKPEENYVNTFYPSTIDPNTAAQLEVSSGLELRGIDIKMVKARVVRVRGNVVSGTGNTPRGGNLMMLPKGRGWGAYLETRHAMVMDAKGTFEFRGITAGQYVITANWGSPDGQMGAFQTVNVSDQPVTGLTIVLRPGITINGTLTVEGRQKGQDREEAEANPIPLTVVLQPDDQGGPWFFGGGRAQVKDDGTFTIKGIQPGRYRVNVFGGGDGYLKSARMGEVDVLADGLEVSDGGASGPLELVRSAKSAEVSGSLQDDKDKPLPGAIAVLLPEEKYREQADRYGTATADQYGAFIIKNVRPGKYKLIAIGDAEGTEWMDPEFVKPYEKAAISLTLEEGQKETRQLTVLPPVALQIR